MAHAKTIVDAVENNGVRFMVGHILRFDPRYVQVYETARPEMLGTPIHLKGETERHPRRRGARREECVDPVLHGRP
jgi:predicted dehydrogenase